MIRPSVAATHRKMLWSIIECSLQCFFPTTLCGVLAFDSVSRSSSSASSRLLLQPHTHLGQTPSFQHPLSHSIFHTQLCQTPSFKCHLSHTLFHIPSFTHNFVNHHLSHTLFHTQLCQTPSFTYHLSHAVFVNHHLSHTLFHTQLCQTPSFKYHLSHTLFHFHIQSFTHPLCQPSSFTHSLSHTTLSNTIFQITSFTPSFTLALMALGDAAALCVAGVALGDIHLRFTWQARHLATSTFVLRGRRGTYGTGWRAWVGFGRG